MRNLVMAGIGLAAGLALGVGAAQAQSGRLTIELNKVEPSAAGCQFHFVVTNGTGTGLRVFSADLGVFDTDGVLTSRSTVSFGRLRANKTHIRTLIFPDVDCGEVGRLLLNDVVQCQPVADESLDCADVLDVSSRADIDLIQ